MIPLAGISRNFFLGRELTKDKGPFKRFDVKKADRISGEKLEEGLQGGGSSESEAPTAQSTGSNDRESNE